MVSGVYCPGSRQFGTGGAGGGIVARPIYRDVFKLTSNMHKKPQNWGFWGFSGVVFLLLILVIYALLLPLCVLLSLCDSPTQDTQKSRIYHLPNILIAILPRRKNCAPLPLVYIYSIYSILLYSPFVATFWHHAYNRPHLYQTQQISGFIAS